MSLVVMLLPILVFCSATMSGFSVCNYRMYASQVFFTSYAVDVNGHSYELTGIHMSALTEVHFELLSVSLLFARVSKVLLVSIPGEVLE